MEKLCRETHDTACVVIAGTTKQLQHLIKRKSSYFYYSQDIPIICGRWSSFELHSL